MAVTANSSGVVTGKFRIPAGVTVGSKRVQFTGSGGSHGEAVFVSDGSITDVVRQRVNQVTVTRTTTNFMPVWEPASRPPDPLAQTFTVRNDMQIGGVDLWFKNAGTSPVTVEIRTVENGIPTSEILVKGWIEHTAISLSGSTRINFAHPLFIRAGVEYAIVVLTDNATAEVMVAELGKWDSANGRWITSQPYSVGVLLSSSNASTWTPHQDRDLAFRLLQVVPSGTINVVNLGTIAVDGATDFMVTGVSDSPVSGATVVYELELPDARKIKCDDSQPINLTSPVTGNVVVRAHITARNGATALLWAGTRVMIGRVRNTADYVSRAFPAGTNSKIRVIYNAHIPSGSSILVEVADGAVANPVWTPISVTGTLQYSETNVEYTHYLASYSANTVRVRLTLTGNAGARPSASNLRVVVT